MTPFPLDGGRAGDGGESSAVSGLARAAPPAGHDDRRAATPIPNPSPMEGEGGLRSPVSGRALAYDAAHSLCDGAGERWPMVDGIAFLRTGREALVREALAALDAGDREGALVHLLADQDDWWTGPAADPERLRALVRDADRLTFREAMDHLGLGRVGDYFAHRWSDPTYLAGLALLEAHGAEFSEAFELACGAGHHLRELHRRGVPCTGADVVFAKLWLARRWVCGDGPELVCFDASAPWPVAGRRFGLVLCCDAFYFLEPKAEIAARLRALTADDGLLAVAHVHNRDAPNLSAGAAVTGAELGALFPGAVAYDDAELTRALAEARAPRPAAWDALGDVEAFSLVLGDDAAPRPVLAGLALPPPEAELRRNPLYGDDDRIAWPSDRYRDEYAPRATYPLRSEAPRHARRTPATEALARSRELLDLPERW